MSVLIKGMEMPTSCEKCPFEREILSRYVCAISGKARNWGLETRLSDCPLVPVPPHGRLGDLDRLEAQWANCDHGAYYDKTNFVRSIQKAPTIIPAEEGE